MSQSPYQVPPPQSFNPPPPTNGIGLFGFILSLAALVLATFTCGIGALLSPLGLLVSLVGLLRAPRGFALAGTILGGVGSGILLLFSGAILALIAGAGAQVQVVQTAAAISQAHNEIEQYRVEHGEFHGGVEGNKLILHIKDGGK